MTDRDGPPWVAVPERLDRRLRLGPFPSGRDAVKFVAAAAVGSLASLLLVPWAGVPVVAVGAVVALWRPDGEPLDERVVAIVRWAARRSVPDGRRSVTGGRTAPTRRETVTLPDGRAAVVVRTAGVPLAFLPPAELARQFERYRDLLRSLDGGWIGHVTSVPIYAGAVLPPESPTTDAEGVARGGYRELVSLLARRRSVRRVVLALPQEVPGVEGARRLEAGVELLRERLADLGVRSERLRDRALVDAARRLGLAGEEDG